MLFLFASAIRVAGIGEEALHDELYHFLAARAYLEDGTLSIVDGGVPYGRAALFTRSAAAFMSIYGDSLAVARIPALLAGSLVAALTFLWLRSEGEKWAAWLAGILISLDPLLIQLSQLVRFYTFQHVAFLLGSMALFSAVSGSRSRSRSLVLAGVGLAFYLVSFELQILSLLGFGGGLLFLAGRWLLRGRSGPPLRWWWVAGALAATAVVAVVFVRQSAPAGLLTALQYADLWASANVDNPRYYYAILYDHYAPLWTLLPLLSLLAIARRPPLACFAISVFAAGFVGLSLLAWKAERYLSYLVPFFLVVASLGVVHAVPLLRRLVEDLLDRLPSGSTPMRARRLASGATVAAVLAYAAIGNRSWLEAGRLVSRDHDTSFPLMGSADGPISWRRFADRARPIADRVQVIVSSDELKAINYLGRVDYTLSPGYLHTPFGRMPEFSLEPQTGVRVVSSAESMELILGCHESGLFVIQALSVDNPAVPRQEAFAYVASVARPVSVPPEWGIVAYEWHTPRSDLRTDCEGTLPRTDVAGQPVNFQPRHSRSPALGTTG